MFHRAFPIKNRGDFNMSYKILWIVILLLSSLLGIVACDDHDDDSYMIWDIYPTIISISVEDARGNDLLNPEVEGNIAENGIKAIYKGEVFEKDSVAHRFGRAYMAVFYGLFTDTLTNGKYVLTVGEFAGDEDFENEEIVIDWNDGSQDTIAFDSKFSWKNKEPFIQRTFYLNGEKTEHPVKIVK